MSRIGLVVVFLAASLTAQHRSRASTHEGGDDDEPGLSPGGQTSHRASARPLSRRHKSKVIGHVVPDSQLRSEPPAHPSGEVKLANLVFGEAIDVNIYNEDGSYNIEALHQVDHILRCKRTGDEKTIEPRLLVVLSHIYDHFGKPLQIVSGYRNQRKETSFHFKGSASDIRIDGVAPKKIVAFASSLDAGGMGIGIYPKSGFVHVDVRPPPSYRWVDYSRSNPNAREKQPPRGWKRKRLQS